MQKHITLQQYFIKLSLTFTKHYAQLLQRFPLSFPNFLWKAKKSWGWFGCSWAEVFLVLLHPKSKVSVKNPTHHTTNSFSKLLPSSREAKAFRKWIPSCVLCGGPQNHIWGALKEQLSLGWGRRP